MCVGEQGGGSPPEEGKSATPGVSPLQSRGNPGLPPPRLAPRSVSIRPLSPHGLVPSLLCPLGLRVSFSLCVAVSVPVSHCLSFSLCFFSFQFTLYPFLNFPPNQCFSGLLTFLSICLFVCIIYYPSITYLSQCIIYLSSICLSSLYHLSSIIYHLSPIYHNVLFIYLSSIIHQSSICLSL